MKQLFISALFLNIITSLNPLNAFSQKNFLSIGPELAFPGNKKGFKDKGTGIGGSLRLESNWSKHVSGIATIGYIKFAKAYPSSFYPTYSNQFDVLPIQIGIKYFSREKKETVPDGFFMSGELGMMFTTNHIHYTNDTEQDFKESGVSLAFGPGYQYKNLEAGFRFQFNLASTGFNVYYYNFRVAYCFLKKKSKN